MFPSMFQAVPMHGQLFSTQPMMVDAGLFQAMNLQLEASRTVNKGLVDRNIHLEEQVTALHKKIEVLDAQLALQAAPAPAPVPSKEVQELEAKLASLHALQAEHTALCKQYDDLEQTAKMFQAEREQAIQQFASEQRLRRDTLDCLMREQKARQDIASQLEDTLEQKAMLEREQARNSEQARNTLRVECEEARKMALQAVRERKEMEQKYTDARKEVNDQKTRADALEKQLTELHQRYAAQAAEQDELQKHADSMHQLANESIDKLAKMERENSKLQSLLQSANELKSNKEKLRKQEQDRCKQLEQRLAASQEQHTKMAKINTKLVDGLKQKLREEEASTSILSRTIIEVNLKLSRMADMFEVNRSMWVEHIQTLKQRLDLIRDRKIVGFTNPRHHVLIEDLTLHDGEVIPRVKMTPIPPSAPATEAAAPSNNPCAESGARAEGSTTEEATAAAALLSPEELAKPMPEATPCLATMSYSEIEQLMEVAIHSDRTLIDSLRNDNHVLRMQTLCCFLIAHQIYIHVLKRGQNLNPSARASLEDSLQNIEAVVKHFTAREWNDRLHEMESMDAKKTATTTTTEQAAKGGGQDASPALVQTQAGGEEADFSAKLPTDAVLTLLKQIARCRTQAEPTSAEASSSETTA